MYTVDEKDVVVPLQGVPESSVGAPLPLLLADEGNTVLAYYIADHSIPWTGTPRVVSPIHSDEALAIVLFRATSHMFGPPNDEAFSGHPLAGRGLKPYGAFQIEHSSWIRQLERMNSVHRSHRPERFLRLRHLVLTFHDSTFECVCSRFEVRTSHGSVRDAVPEMVRLLYSDFNGTS